MTVRTRGFFRLENARRARGSWYIAVMQRREFLAGTPAVLATACTNDDIAPTPSDVRPAKKKEPKPEPRSEAKAEVGVDHSHHHSADGDSHADLATMEAAAKCASMGQICLQHCLVLLAAGDTAMAPCAQATNDMLAVSQATAALAASGSPQLKAQAGVAIEAATRCEVECRKHADKHPTCRDCADSCKAAVAAYRTLVG